MSQRAVRQLLSWGHIEAERLSPADTMFVTTGRRLYVVGDIDGGFRPRSNPYDLYAFGQPLPDDPLAGKLQGVWAQPVKGLSGYRYEVELDGVAWQLDAAESFTQSMDSVRFHFSDHGIRAERTDTAALDEPLLLTSLTLVRELGPPVDVSVRFTAHFDLQDAWFTTLGDRRNTAHQVTEEDGRLIARADVDPRRWVVAVGGVTRPDRVEIEPGSGSLCYQVRLERSRPARLTFGLAISSDSAGAEAADVLTSGLTQVEALRAQKSACYADLRVEGPRLESPDPELDTAFALALSNLQMLEAETSRLGRFCYAGLEVFPFWFSADAAYSMTGMMIAGLQQTAIAHARLGARFLGRGRVPHQISPAGHVAFEGNAPETPLWVLGIRDAYRWSGDRQLLRDLFPRAWAAMFDYVLTAIDPDGDGYPSGPGMVEVDGLGAETLDSAAYTWAALGALAEIADVLGEHEKAAVAGHRADQIAGRFTTDWWDEPSGAFAMSLGEPGHRRQADPHWAVITPLEVGLAGPAEAAATLSTVRREHLNRWGLQHTAGADERVWTLPTATLSRAAYRNGDPHLGFAMLRLLVEPLEHGPIGLFHELIPEGASILQLWSAATLLRGVVEDLLGIDARAGEHTLSVHPQLPEGWDRVALHNLRFGEHLVSVIIEHGKAQVTCHEGSELRVESQGEAVRHSSVG